MNKLGIIIEKLAELKNLIIDKPISEQKEIIINFFHKNKKISKHFKNFYKTCKDIFERYSDDNPILKEFIEKTFINRELIDYSVPIYSTLKIHTSNDLIIKDKKINDFNDNFIWKDLTDSNNKKDKRIE